MTRIPTPGCVFRITAVGSHIMPRRKPLFKFNPNQAWRLNYEESQRGLRCVKSRVVNQQSAEGVFTT